MKAFLTALSLLAPLALAPLALAQDVRVEELSSIPLGTFSGYVRLDNIVLSPDEKMVAFRHQSHLRVVDLRTKQVREVISDLGQFSEFSFSPDSQSMRIQTSKIYSSDKYPPVMGEYENLPLAGGPRTKVKTKPVRAQQDDPMRRVDFRETRNGLAIELAMPDRSRRLIAEAKWFRNPWFEWSADRSTLRLIYFSDAQHYFISVNGNTGEKKDLATGHGYIDHFLWRPTEGLYFSLPRSNDAISELWRYPPTGGEAVRIGSFEDGYGEAIAPMRDGTLLVLRFHSNATFWTGLLNALQIVHDVPNVPIDLVRIRIPK